MQTKQPELNSLLERVEPSKSVRLLNKTKEMQRTDPDILNFTGGEPDFSTPEPIIQEAFRQMTAGNTHYVDPKGDPELRAALAEKLARENGAPYSADNILVTPGGKYAIYAAVQALINPGDEVLWLAPGWVSYPAITTLCGGTPVAVHLDYNSDYAISADQLESLTTEKTKLLIINYPNNPTGKILTEQDRVQLKAYLLRHPNVIVLADEIYEKLVYGESRHISLASDPELFDRVITVNGFSKCSAMTGWRIGYLACSPAIYAGVSKIFQHSMSCSASFVQKAAIVALHVEDETERMRRAYQERLEFLLENLRGISKLECRRPDGAFYLWVRFDTDLSSEELCGRLLTQAKIAGIPGSAYGEDAHCMVRFCYAAEKDKLQEFVKRLRTFCETL